MDWKSLIADLQARGYSQTQIAGLCDCGQATINELARGKAKRGPGFALGLRLANLHKKAMRKPEKAEG